ncbi:MAG TPA: glycosyltransferase family 39 protein [Vicinamibacterales bacterium]|nr:glycosyltransferase family 39 protein [Vicinamibacterales bacterium]
MGSSAIKRRLPLATAIVGLAAAVFILRVGGFGAGWLPSPGTLCALYAVLALSAQIPDDVRSDRLVTFARTHGFAIGVALVVALGIAVRLPHLNAELGHAPIDIDEHRLAENVHHFFSTGELVHTTVEHYPGLVFWLFSGASFIGYMRILSGGRAIPVALLPVERFVAWARIANLGVAAGIICLTALIGKRVFNSWTGVAAAALVAVAPLSTATTLVVRNDPGMVLAVLAAVYCAIESLENDRLPWIAGGGAAAGIAVGIKYSSVFVIITIIAAALCKGTSARRILRTFVGCVAFAVAVAVTNHFIWSDVPNFLRQLSDQIAITGAGHWAATADPAGMYVRTLAGRDGVGVGLLIAGVAFAVYSLTVPTARSLVFLTFPILYMWFMTHRPSQFARWVFPLLPFAAIAGMGVLIALVKLQVPEGMVTSVRQKTALSRAAAVLVAIAMLWQPLVGAVADVSRRAGTPTQTLAERWLAQHVQQGQVVLTEYGWLDLGGLPTPARRVPDLRALLDGGVAACRGATWVVVPEPDFGHATLASLALVKRFHASSGFGGNTGFDYEIYRVPGASPPQP